jgi:hypothetical protein
VVHFLNKGGEEGDTLEKIFTEKKGGGSGRRAGSPATALLWRER